MSIEKLELVERNCPICKGKNASEQYYSSTFDRALMNEFSFSSRKIPENMHLAMHFCRACSLLYSSPAFRPEALHSLYKEAAFDRGSESRYAAMTYVNKVSGILKRNFSGVSSSARVLDVGAADGAFLYQLIKNGIPDVWGVEPSEAPLRESEDLLSVRIKKASFGPGLFEPQSFDVVTCFQTIEHLHEPLEVFKEVFNLLRPGGLFIVVCHNRDAMLNRLMGEKSPIFDIEHLQLFCPNSLANIFTAAGFKSPNHLTLVNRYPISYWLRLAPIPTQLKRGANHVLRATHLNALSLPFRVGNIMGWAVK